MLKLENVIDLAIMFPIVDAETMREVFEKLAIIFPTEESFAPVFITEEIFNSEVIPIIGQKLSPENLKILLTKINKTFALRKNLNLIEKELTAIVGKGNISFAWLKREEFSCFDNTKRSIYPEAVISIYNAEFLKKVITILTEKQIPIYCAGKHLETSYPRPTNTPYVVLNLIGNVKLGSEYFIPAIREVKPEFPRILAMDTREIMQTRKSAKFQPVEAEAINTICSQAKACINCNQCVVCPINHIEQEMIQKSGGKATEPLIPYKLSVLQLMEKLVLARINSIGKAFTSSKTKEIIHVALKESNFLLKKCIYCGMCEKECGGKIKINKLYEAWRIIGNLPERGHKILKIYYSLLFGSNVVKGGWFGVFKVLFYIYNWVMRPFLKLSIISNVTKSFFILPKYSPIAYKFPLYSSKKSTAHNFHIFSSNSNIYPGVNYVSNEVFLRFRSCLETFANPEVTRSVDDFLVRRLGINFVDLSNTICCGFPFEAEGFIEKSEEARINLLVEIVKAASTLNEIVKNKTQEYLKLTIFANCPNCLYVLNELKLMLQNPAIREILRKKANIPTSAYLLPSFSVKDTAEVACEYLPSRIEKNTQRKVVLKIPCRNTQSETAAQIKLLSSFFTKLTIEENCCGMGYAGRYKLPKIGTFLAEKMFTSLLKNQAKSVVSACPCCREGIRVQQDIMLATDKNNPNLNFAIGSIFEEIAKV